MKKTQMSPLKALVFQVRGAKTRSSYCPYTPGSFEARQWYIGRAFPLRALEAMQLTLKRVGGVGALKEICDKPRAYHARMHGKKA